MMRKLRRKRLALGITQEELARLAGVTRRTIQNLEDLGYGRRAHTRIRRGISTALGMQESSLFRAGVPR